MTPTMMITSFIAATILSLSSRANGAVVTLYHAGTATVPFEGPSDSIDIGAETKYSYIGPARETGVTLYAAEEVISRYRYAHGTGYPALTVISEPVTRTWVMEHGASVHREVIPGIATVASDGYRNYVVGTNQNCKLEPEKNKGVCVEWIELPLSHDVQGTIYYTTTLDWSVATRTAPLRPLATVTVASGAPTSGTPTSSTPTSTATTSGATTSGASMMVVISAILMTGILIS